MKFYEQTAEGWPCHFRLVDMPEDMECVAENLYGLHESLAGDVRLIFESMTGMQKIWGGEDAILKFYSHSCPRLYELDTIAYWIMENLAHSQELKAQINQTAQVAIELSIKRGTTALTILKAENRGTEDINEPHRYWSKDLTITFESEKSGPSRVNLGLRIKELRLKRGLSQAELAKLVGVTASTVSQVEANIIYPSLPALLKMTEVLSVDITSVFQHALEPEKRIIFPAAEAVSVGFRDLPKGALDGSLLTPPDFEGKMEPYLIEIEPHAELPAHFFIHKGEEMGYLMSGKLRTFIKKASYTIRAGDVIYLSSEMPSQWKNPGPNVARLLWIKAK
jgi:transcriptional regulator with XRE-family HTH domain